MQSCDFEAGQITSTKISKLTSKILKITSTFDKKKPQNFKKVHLHMQKFICICKSPFAKVHLQKPFTKVL